MTHNCLQSHREIVAIKLEVLKALVPVVTTLGKHIQDTMPAILNSCWFLLQNRIALYSDLAVNSDDGAAVTEVKRIHLHMCCRWLSSNWDWKDVIGFVICAG